MAEAESRNPFVYVGLAAHLLHSGYVRYHELKWKNRPELNWAQNIFPAREKKIGFDLP